MIHRIALLGLGVVGQGLAEILRDKGVFLRNQYGFDAQIVAISDLMKGSLYNPNGLNIDAELLSVKETGKLEQYPKESGLEQVMKAL